VKVECLQITIVLAAAKMVTNKNHPATAQDHKAEGGKRGERG